MASTKARANRTSTNDSAPKTRYEGELTANSKRNRPAIYYKLSEKDHEIIIKGLTQFVSVYQIAAKIGCGYSTLKKYILEHPELKEVQDDSQRGELEFVKGKFMQKIASGSLGAMCFYLERKGGWTNKQQVDIMNQPLPNITLGVIPESELPQDGVGEPESISSVQQIALKDDSGTLVREDEKERRREIEEAEAEQEEEPTEAEGDFEDNDWGNDDEEPSGLF